jgi:signal transduction histidine kinase
MVEIWLGFALGVLVSAPAGWLLLRRTTSRAREMQRRALAAERLAELGTLTGGLAHEIKNPLSTIGLNVQLLEEDLSELVQQSAGQPGEEQGARARRRVQALHREITRLRSILEDFLRFAGRIRLDLATTDINAVVAELADFFAPQAQAARVNIRTQLDAQPSRVPLDAPLFKQALLNLLINATHAMTEARDAGKPNGGCDELLIRTRRGRDELTVHVIDTGPGIEPDVLHRIFQPYFSTRKGGTGLGLPTTRRIIEEHGGSIACHSESGRGTEFTITLPAGEPAGPASPS